MGGRDPLHIVVVGHSQTSKCQIANALCNIDGSFKAFLCRVKLRFFKNPTLETPRTVKGHSTKVVVTPHIDTPAWSHQVKTIKSFKLKLLMYVENDDFVNTDHERYILNLHKCFKCHVICVQYSMGRQQCFIGRRDSFTESIIYTDITLNHGDSFRVKSETAQAIFQHISDINIESQRIEFTGPLSVGATSSVNTKAVDDAEYPAVDKEAIESVETNEGQEAILDPVVDVQEEECYSLPPVNDQDMELFSATLRDGSARSNHVRVNVVGNQEAGKTTLIQRLQDIEVDCPDNLRNVTEGLDISQVTMKCIEKGGKRIWNTNVKGYEEELNLQRMAFAVQRTEEKRVAVQRTEEKRAEEETSEQTPTENTPGSDISVADMNESIYFSSECVEEEIHQTGPEINLSQLNNIEQKKMYLQKVKGWRERNKDESMYISFWDFAGQSTYYSTHQAFLAPSAVYLLVFDLSVKLDTKLKSKLTFKTHMLKQYTVEETLKFWVSSIKAYTRDTENGTAPFIIVGTHCGKVKKHDIEETFGRIRRALKDVSDVEFIAIDNTRENKTDMHLQSLKDKILDLGLGVIDEEIPARWINLENTLLQKKNFINCLTFEEVMDLDAKSDNPINERDQVLKFLEHEHRRGFLMFYNSCCHNELVILDASILANFFNTLLRPSPNTRIQSSFRNRNGIVLKKFVTDVAMKMFGTSTAIVNTIVATLQYLYIVHEFKEEHYFVPSLLPHRDVQEQFKESQQCKKLPTLRLSFTQAFIPPSFFHLLLSAMNDKEGGLQIRHKDDDPVLYNLFASYIYYEEMRRLEIYWQECKIYFELKNYSKRTNISSDTFDTWKCMLNMVKKKIEKIMSIYRQENVQYYFEVQCPHDGAYIELEKLQRKDDEAMCPKDHAVSMQDVFLEHPLMEMVGNEEKHRGEATHKDLGRLSRYLSRENAHSLAAKLKLRPCDSTAAKASQTWPEHPEMQRFQLLETWKRQNPNCTKTDLLRLLSKLDDHNDNDLAEVLGKHVRQCQYPDLDESDLNAVPDQIMISKFSDCIGKDWPFLMTELGLEFTALETELQNNPYDLTSRVQKLLSKWVQEFTEEATTRVVLDTASFIGVNTKDIVSKIKK